MSDSMMMLFEDRSGRPIPRLVRAPDGAMRVADGIQYFSTEQAAPHFKMSVPDLEKYWLDVWADLIHRDNAAADALDTEAAQLELAHEMKHPELCQEHFDQLARVAKAFSFNLWNREIYGKIVHDPITNRPELSICVGIYGLRRRARDSGECGGCGIPEWEKDADGNPTVCRQTVYRKVNGVDVPYTGVAFWEECAPEPGVSEFWDRQPFTALEYRAEAKAWRKGFGEMLAGLWLPDEIPTGDRTSRRRGGNGGAGSTTPADPLKAGDEPPTTRIGFEIAAKGLGLVDDRHRSHVIGMMKARWGALFDHDERAFWERAFHELRSNLRKYAPPTAI